MLRKLTDSIGMSCKAALHVDQEEQDGRCDRLRVVTVTRVLDRLKKRESSIKKLAVLFLLTELLASLFNGNNYSHQEIDQNKHSRRDLDGQSLPRGLLHIIVLVAANNDDAYAEANAESPAVEALDDDDDDDEELNASASNDYPDGENDESYEDGDDDRQETRITERWTKPLGEQDGNSLFTLTT